MNKVITGNTIIEGKPYSFFLDDFLLHLVPSNFENALLPFTKIDFDTLKGTTCSFHEIFFLGVHIQIGLASELSAYISGYLLGKNNLREAEIEQFSSISFYGKIVDNYYHPFRKFDTKNSIFDFEEGSSTISLLPYQATNFKIDLLPSLILEINVSSPHNPNPDNLSLGELHSYLRLVSAEPWEISNIVGIYKRIFDIFTFFNFRKNICFEHILISKTNKAGLYSPIAELFVRSPEERFDMPRYRTITHEDIKDKFKDIYLMSPFEKFLLFVPENELNATFLTYDTYSRMCSTFEGLFDMCSEQIYKGYTDSEHAANEMHIKSRIVGLLSNLRLEYLDERRDIINDYINKYSLPDEQTLRTKFLTVLRNEKTVLEKVYPRVKFNSRFNSRIAYLFAEQRNSLQHGRTEIISDIQVTPYTIACCLIYIMLLHIFNVDTENITNIVKKVFENYRCVAELD